MNKADLAKSDIAGLVNDLKLDIQKAAETISTYTFSPTSRSVFSPENLDEEIKYLTPKQAPLRNRLPRTSGMGQHAEWKKMTSKLHTNVGVSGGTNTTIAFADAGAPSETAQSYSTAVAAYKLLGRKLEVGGLALAASRGRDGQPDMQDEREKKVKMLEVMLGEEEMIISGDTDNSALEFNGLGDQITTYSGTLGAFVTVSGLEAHMAQGFADEEADYTAFVAHPNQMVHLANDLARSGSITRVNVDSPAGGVTAGTQITGILNPVTGSRVDLIPHRFVGGTAYLLTEKSPTGENWIEMEDLIPMSRIDVPSSNFSYVSFILEASVLKLIGEPYQKKFAGLTTSSLV